MKFIVNLLRVLVGLLFIFSGFIKANDPTGFSYKLDEYFYVFAQDLEVDQDSLIVEIVSPDGTESAHYQILNNDDLKYLELSNTPWKASAIDMGGVMDSIYASDLSIRFNGAVIADFMLEVMDSSDQAIGLKVLANVKDKEVLNKAINVAGFSSVSENLKLEIGSFVKEDAWYVSALQNLRKFALPLAIFIVVLEMILGLALIIGWQKKWILWLILLMIIFFTFLTGYSAIYEKVTDCGCFGDAIPLTPWESFYKDIILLVAILIIFFGIKHIRSIFSNPFAVKVLTVFTLISTGFAYYCYHFLPVLNYLKFEEGKDIAELMKCPPDAPQEIREMIFVYTKDGQDYEFTEKEWMEQKISSDKSYVYKDRIDKIIQEGCEPPIHDFHMFGTDRETDYVEDFLADETPKFLWVMFKVEESNLKSMKKYKSLIDAWRKLGYNVYPLTASSAEAVEAFKHEHGLAMDFYYGDDTNLKSIIRSNPGLVLFKGSELKKMWPSTRLPKDVKQMESYLE